MAQQTFLFWQWLLAIMGMIANAAAAMPPIVILGLAIGRRGNGDFCIRGSSRLLKAALVLSPSGVLFFICEWLIQIQDYSALANLLLEPASLPYVSSACIWLLGSSFLYLAACALGTEALHSDRYKLSQLKGTLLWCILAACCYFSTFFLINWPFAGLPEGLAFDRAFMAILRNGSRQYFCSLCPAGALALLFAFHWQKDMKATPRQRNNAIRWLSVWAAGGYLPYLLQRGGITLGIWLRGNATLTTNFPGFWTQACSLCLLALAIACWVYLFVARRKLAVIAWLGAALLVARESAPYIARLARMYDF